MPNFNEDDKRFEQLVCRIEPNGKLLSVREMTGGVSARVTAIEMVLGSGQIATRIVRRHGEADLKRNPGIAAAEFKLLQMLRSEGLSVPEPYDLDESCGIFPQPYLVIGYVEGEIDLNPANLEIYLFQMAANLAAIHHVDCPSQCLPFLTRQEKLAAEMLDQDSVQTSDSLNESRIRETLTAVWPLKQTNQTALLHGDYWPGNILWEDGRLAAIID
ncbi:phosphotransferase family protein [Paenibacillus apii]|uniref:phosphotransferase family protein n=1 Tax=Paenibacillus apii TaxID=1850370 RepID=UPI001F27224C|nr:phosphotransferase [Paenibacillus apii]